MNEVSSVAEVRSQGGQDEDPPGISRKANRNAFILVTLFIVGLLSLAYFFTPLT